ncbi:hypothetical protein IWZ00DRAFT_545660 [Phyllosticta capitalensis]
MASTEPITNAVETPAAPVVAQVGLVRKASLRRDSGPGSSSPSPAARPSPAPSAISQAISSAPSSVTTVADEVEDDLAIAPCPASAATEAITTTTASASTKATASPLAVIINRATASPTKHLRRFLLFLLRTDYLTFDTKSGAQISWRIPFESTLPFCKVNLRLGPWADLSPAQRSNLANTALRPAAALGIPPAAVLEMIARYQKRSYVGPTGRYKAGLHADLVKHHGLGALAAKLVRDRDVLIPALTGDWWAGEEVDETESLKAIGEKLVAAVAAASTEVFETLGHDLCVLRPDAMETQARAGRSLFRCLRRKQSPVPKPGPLRELSLKGFEAEQAAKFGELVEAWEAWEMEDKAE